MTAILFGSISSLADTSELQREAFNAAFAQHGLDWRWDRAEYVDMLEGNGGQDRIAQYAAARGDDVDATAVHATKSQLFQEALGKADVVARPGVVDTIRAARADGRKVGLVTTTSADNLEALGEALADQIDFDALDVIVDASQVDQPKPDPAAYTFALEQLGESPDAAVAVEDNVGGVAAAHAAGIRVVAFPNVNTQNHDFDAADAARDEIVYADLVALIEA